MNCIVRSECLDWAGKTGYHKLPGLLIKHYTTDTIEIETRETNQEASE